MFYIEKNDKPSWLEKKLNIVKVIDNTIILPTLESTSQIEKMALKTKKIIEKYSNSKKIVISKEIEKEDTYINYLNTYGIEISDGKWLFEILVPEIIEYIINKKQLENFRISFLINDLTNIEIENIKILARKYKLINIITNHIEKFKNLERILDEEGIVIAVTNNKKKSLIKSEIILNIDFPQELINKFNIKEDAVIVNIKGKTKINKKRFNGLCVNDYEIDFRDDRKSQKALNSKYSLKNLYESELYKKQRIDEIRNKIKFDKVVIKYLILNNGEL